MFLLTKWFVCGIIKTVEKGSVIMYQTAKVLSSFVEKGWYDMERLGMGLLPDAVVGDLVQDCTEFNNALAAGLELGEIPHKAYAAGVRLHIEGKLPYSEHDSEPPENGEELYYTVRIAPVNLLALEEVI